MDVRAGLDRVREFGSNFLRGARQTWTNFTKFLYNSQEKTVLGRGGKSWLKIIVFYFFYYGFLACLFAVSITLVLNSLDEDIPRYQTRLQTPGVAIQPKLRSEDVQSSEIVFTVNQIDTDGTTERQPDDERGLLYASIMKSFLWAYSIQNQTDKTRFQKCSPSQPPLRNSDDEKSLKVCLFDKEDLGPCGAYPYGYDTGDPCILVKLNRIINWLPVGYTDLQSALGNDDSDAPPLGDLLAEYSKVYRPYLTYTFCYGAKAKDEANLNGGKRTNTKYHPTENGFPISYYPYLGKNRQPHYLNPLVAVQFTNVTRNVDIDVRCKVYARNIRDNKEMGEGFFSFKLKVKDQKKN